MVLSAVKVLLKKRYRLVEVVIWNLVFNNECIDAPYPNQKCGVEGFVI